MTTTQNNSDARPCGFAINGPKVGRRVVAWRKHCKRITTDPSGRCWQHRPLVEDNA